MAKRTRWIASLIIAALTALALGGGAVAQQIADVPASHWAYEAVQELVAKGYLTLENNRFDGNQPVDRFTLATVVARILNEIETGGVVPQSEEDVALLRRVVNEFREDLVRAFAQIGAVSERVDDHDRALVVAQGEMSAVHARIAELLQSIDERARELEARLAGAEARLDGRIDQTHADLEARIDETGSTLTDRIDGTAASLGQRIDGTEAALNERIDGTEAAFDAKLTEVSVSLTGRISETETALNNRITSAEVALNDRIDETRSELAATIDERSAAQTEALALTATLIREEIEQLARLVDQGIVDGLGNETAARQALRAEVLDLIASIRAEARQDIAKVEDRIAQTQTRVTALETALQSGLDAQGIELGDLQGRLAAATAQIEEELNRLSAELQDEIKAQLQTEKERLDRLAIDFQTLMDEIGSEVNAHTEALMRQQFDLDAHRSQLDLHQAQLLEQQELLEDYRGVLDQIIARLDAQAGAIAGNEARIEAQEAALVAQQEEIGGQQAELAQHDEALAAQGRDIAEQQQELAAQQQALALQQQELAEQRALLETQRAELEALIATLSEQIDRQAAALARVDGEILRSIESMSASIGILENQVAANTALRDDIGDISARLEGVERQVLAMQSQIGLSEEQINALRDHLMAELESQYQHSFLLAGQVAQELDALRAEFNSYRQATEKSLASAGQAQTFAIVGALLGLIGLVAN